MLSDEEQAEHLAVQNVYIIYYILMQINYLDAVTVKF